MSENEAPEKLQYQLLGADSDTASEKIAKYTGDVDWAYLKPHYKHGNLIYVDPELNLSETAEAFVKDDKAKVQGWLKSADLVKPTSLHADWWEHEQSRFTAVIVTPFVLAQPLPKNADS